MKTLAGNLEFSYCFLADNSDPHVDFTYHADTIAHICEIFSTDVEKGLTTEQAAINREKSGKNKYRDNDYITKYTKCKRDGEYQHFKSRKLTIGDIVSLEAPLVVPATASCLVNKSILTGESEPQKVSSEKTDDNPLDTQNIVFATTKIVQGACTGIVVNVGKHTTAGAVRPFVRNQRLLFEPKEFQWYFKRV